MWLAPGCGITTTPTLGLSLIHISDIPTRGAKEDLMLEIAEMIDTVLSNVDNEQVSAEVRARVNAKMKEYPLFAY